MVWVTWTYSSTTGPTAAITTLCVCVRKVTTSTSSSHFVWMESLRRLSSQSRHTTENLIQYGLNYTPPPTEPLATQRTRGDAIHSDAWNMHAFDSMLPWRRQDERKRAKNQRFMSRSPAVKLTQIDPLIVCVLRFSAGGEKDEILYSTINRTKQGLVKLLMSSGGPECRQMSLNIVCRIKF